MLFAYPISLVVSAVLVLSRLLGIYGVLKESRMAVFFSLLTPTIAMRRFFAGEFAAINPVFTPQTFIFTRVLCLVLSVISGFYPAWRASQLDPVVALRHE